jgi:isocitrate/isopropylmalate dehydrogenase
VSSYEEAALTSDSKSQFFQETVSVRRHPVQADSLGPEVVAQAVRVLETIVKHSSLQIELQSHDFGGIAIDNHGVPLPDSTLNACKSADAVLMGRCE